MAQIGAFRPPFRPDLRHSALVVPSRSARSCSRLGPPTGTAGRAAPPRARTGTGHNDPVARRTSAMLPRDLHPAAWWLWALCLAVAASRTTNPWILLTIVAVACQVVASRRSDAPWALAFRLYLYVAAFVVIVRIVFRVVFGGTADGTVLISLPEIPLPEAAAGISLLGDVTAEMLLSGLYDGLRLATMIVCVGAANALANPKRLLKSLPPALNEIGTAVIVAVSVLPQLADSLVRVRRARRLRGDTGRRHALRGIVVPILEDALERSVHLAASMDARGYGRAGSASATTRALTGALMIAGLAGLAVGVYALLDATAPGWLATPMIVLGVALSLTGFALSGRRVERTRYRPDRWRIAELQVAASGLIAALGVVLAARFAAADLNPYAFELGWPGLDPLPWLAVLVAVLPAVCTPPPARSVAVPAGLAQVRA